MEPSKVHQLLVVVIMVDYCSGVADPASERTGQCNLE